MKMVPYSDVEKTSSVIFFQLNYSVNSVQLYFPTNYGKDAPTRKSVYN